MKLQKDTLEKMREAIAPLDTPELRDRYRTGDFPRSADVNDLDMRYRWDLLWTAGGYRLLPEDRSDIYTDHIDTALRRIVPTLKEKP